MPVQKSQCQPNTLASISNFVKEVLAANYVEDSYSQRKHGKIALFLSRGTYFLKNSDTILLELNRQKLKTLVLNQVLTGLPFFSICSAFFTMSSCFLVSCFFQMWTSCVLTRNLVIFPQSAQLSKQKEKNMIAKPLQMQHTT